MLRLNLEFITVGSSSRIVARFYYVYLDNRPFAISVLGKKK